MSSLPELDGLDEKEAIYDRDEKKAFDVSGLRKNY